MSTVAAMAAPFQVEVSVGWLNAHLVCNPATPCLGFAGVGGFAGTINLRTLLRILSPDGPEETIGDGTGGDLTYSVSFLETKNQAPCKQTSNTLKSTCDDPFTFISLVGIRMAPLPARTLAVGTSIA